MSILKRNAAQESSKYTKEQKKALKVFGEYISCDNPYKNMSKRTYNKVS